jgi:hypothetical protein
MLRRITQVNILFAEALKENPLLRSEKLAFRLTLATADIYELARPNPQGWNVKSNSTCLLIISVHLVCYT